MAGRYDYDDDSDDEYIQSSDQFKERHDSCTDIPCCCLWIVCLMAFFTVMGYGFVNGNLKRLHHGIDNQGRVCGVDPNVTDKPYTFFCASSSWLAGSLGAAGMNFNNPVCVAACPLQPFGLNASDVGVIPGVIPECGWSPNGTSLSTVAYKTNVQMNYCMPDSAIHNAAKGEAVKAISGLVPTLQKAADSILLGWPVYIMMFFMAVFLGYAYLCCLKVFARIMIWLSIIVAFFALALVGGYLLYQAPTIGTNTVMEANFGKFATMMARIVGAACCAGAVGMVCLVCCCAGQIEYAVIAVQMTTDVMANIPSLLVAPVIKAVIKFKVAMFLAIGFVYLLSCAKPKQLAGSAMLRHYEFQDHEWYLIIFYGFMFYWIMAFLTALYQFSVAYATADYFFAVTTDAEGGRDVGCCNLIEALCVGLLWHQGSFAFGSAIIAVFSMIQRTIEYIESQNRDAATGKTLNPCVTILTCCCMCCVTMCKSCAEFINKNAYIGIAIKGYNFCTACKKALKVMIENAAGMAILNGATFVFQLAGLLLITACCIFISDAICQLSMFTDPGSKWFLPNPSVTVLVSALIGFAMAKIFMDVFDMVSDTLMYCFGLEGFNKNSPKVPDSVRMAVTEAEMKQSGYAE